MALQSFPNCTRPIPHGLLADTLTPMEAEVHPQCVPRKSADPLS